jgi:bifunctional UDP-N-acetylglucosamine pyrophosphorylase/glucosamine-1-phosphate N-acetyltransferase
LSQVRGLTCDNLNYYPPSIVNLTKLCISYYPYHLFLLCKSKVIDSKIGNFVEIKNSTLFDVKAGHLSYLGDSEIDKGTNIGAGTITCNYDGINKHKTKIGKNVFVGSDSHLIAPVVIEDDVIIAAGSTITKNVKKGDLAISRNEQKSVKGFYYKFFNKDEK